MATIYKEVWTGEMVKALRAGLDGKWLDGVSDQSAFVGNDVIHLVDVGVDPDVLVNNTTYPIDIQELEDGDISVSLDKFQTKATPVTDDELYSISYDKMGRVRDSHAEAINEAKYRKAAHAIAPSGDSEATPAIATTGADDGTGRARICRADIIALKARFDALHVPVEGRRLVLSNEHVNDLLLEDQKFADQYYNYSTGRIANLYGFAVYEYGDCPRYTQEGTKQALGSTEGSPASFAFYTPYIFKATGTTKVYISEAASDPANQQNLINYRHYFIAMPKKQYAVGAIYSGMPQTPEDPGLEED